MALTDATAFQLCMANAAMFMAQRKQPDTFQYEKCSEALEYYGQCLRQVTKRLECRDDCTSEGVIVTVLGLICHDIYVGSWTRWETHMKGLHRIIQVRGGYKNIDSNLALWASWYDVLGSATHDTYPHFPEYMNNLPSRLPGRTPLLEHIICKLMHENNAAMCPVINALDRIKVIADIVNARHHEPEFWRREDDLSPLHTIGPVAHILLSTPRLDLQTDGTIDSAKLFCEMTRLCMLILLAALKRLYSFALDEIELTTLTAKFSLVLSIYWRSPSLYQPDDALQSLQLWSILIVAALQPFVDRTLYVAEIRRCMHHMGIQSATDALQRSRDIAWVDVVCGMGAENETLLTAIDNAAQP
ncbi:hypothetical protein TSTA_021670 [Talaromyces stipitatus ATCC 10500]|uniref:Zn(II)2Cys6 transcription factor n=1 Tax=Talaromyces stipitatus (strain ATCC 10500 / CBS 375.48 / QM 6759 / NRRL 1006) TaxID=441959 RepID=B8MHD1_TALSN|nr:uncharacterized protein TSTA_021670 [Talaromyces stipitatus ATCC 10500]EED17110.1 hypothetical protein TSTA_021670 [Talaromyces stipitatus ATCC 10500]